MFLCKKYFLLVVIVLLFTVNILAAINDDLEELNVKEFVDREVSGHSITVFSKSYCPYCRRCITLLKKLNISDLRVIQLDEMAEGAEIQDELMKRTGRRTVPSVWIAKQFIGGSDDVHHAHREGRLQKLLQEKGISFTDFKDEL
ncbi:hypothetical protein C9374_003795 [Naegleria lovaniensis]|uniref:Glutaredoxin domain-containing protein n=1 Tax=Naegleria lovaniensis TaxID=51637 RepID=A0AA88H864_NAELO|nr:uncharacterized protein C9374_003795 [Naegleria lovaniensis]KAG2394031.1 hypothetical protein C9374_003795 [Naegleria lovaniensis]